MSHGRPRPDGGARHRLSERSAADGIVWAGPTRRTMKAEHIKDRLHEAMHRAPKASEEELAEVTAVVLAVLSEVTAELAAVIAELAARVEALENAAG